jgi:hypothetical protein
MKRRLVLTVAICVLLSARRAAAQEVAIGYQGLPYKAPGESKTGVNLGEGLLLHVGVGAEAGWDSNVFYANAADPLGVKASAILRLTTFGELTNASRTAGGGAQTGLSYDVRAGLTYRRYLSTDASIVPYRDAWMPTAGLSLGSGIAHWSFQLSDTFVRQEDTPYQAAGSPISRDDNMASVQAQWSPGGGRITGTLRYVNTIDVFEQGSGFDYANSLSHQLMLDASWKWLPKTAVFFQATQGYVTYLNSDNGGAKGKVASYPLHLIVGLRGLITQKTSASVALGYANGFYSSGATTNGFLGSTYVNLQLVITPSMLNRVALGFHQDFVNSVISNFYYETAFYASYVQQIAGRLAFDLSGRISHRSYEGLLFVPGGTARTDNPVVLGATLDYFIRNWAYAGVGYSLSANLTDYKLGGVGMPGDLNYAAPIPVSYVKHQVFARLGLTY